MMVFKDFSVAFNCLFCSSIISAALDAGFSRSAALLLASTLSGRRLQVQSQLGSSEWRNFHRGVGQGSRLGPILYILANSYATVLSGD